MPWVSLLKEIPTSDFVAVNESCLVVNPDSGQTQARPECRSKGRKYRGCGLGELACLA
jgi:hypothetical protein